MKTPRGYRRLPNGLLKKSTAGGRRKRKAGGRKKRKQRGRGHKKGHKGGGLGYAGLRVAQATGAYAPKVVKALAPFVRQTNSKYKIPNSRDTIPAYNIKWRGEDSGIWYDKESIENEDNIQ